MAYQADLDDEILAVEAKIQALAGAAVSSDDSYSDDESVDDEQPAISYRDDVEDRLAWDQQGQVEEDAYLAHEMQIQATGMIPAKTRPMHETTPGGLLVKTFSSEKYDKMLAKPGISAAQRRQIMQMRDKRIAKEGMDITRQTQLLNKFETLSNDASIAEALAASEGNACGQVGAVSEQIKSLQEELGITPEAAEAAMAGINQMWQTEDQLAREEDEDRTNIFFVDLALAAAEGERVDQAICSKMVPDEAKGGGKGGLSPTSQAVAMAMPIGGGATSTGLASLDSLIAQLAGVAQIDETALRAYVNQQRRGSLIHQLADTTGVDPEALAAFIRQNSTM